jgi:hypothetical protein
MNSALGWIDHLADKFDTGVNLFGEDGDVDALKFFPSKLQAQLVEINHSEGIRLVADIAQDACDTLLTVNIKDCLQGRFHLFNENNVGKLEKNTTWILFNGHLVRHVFFLP